MAEVIVKLKCVLADPDVDLDEAREKIEKNIKKLKFKILGIETEDVAFGIKAIIVRFAMDEKIGNYDSLEEDLKDLDEVSSVETLQVSRAFG
ncbi:MAG: elongation factor 1-beta [Candidatus Nanoarchaeia archaeon]|nr:elongation factor 1-beta [Candidatus Nanoarchaeia archaeon]